MSAQARAFIEAEQAGSGNVVQACELLDVSRSAYHQWHQHTPSAREICDQELIERIENIHRESKGTYGAPRIRAELAEAGLHVGKKRVARLMIAAGPGGASA
jgi:hypothetical protein